MRFPAFTDDWKKTIFKEVCKISTGSKNTQDKIDNGLYPFYVRSQTIERINEYTYDGEAILTAGDGVGVGKVFHYSTGKIGVHQRVYLLTDFKCDGKYLFYYFSSKFYDRVKKMSAKNSVDSVRMEMIADMPISLPSLKEQTQIGILLSKLDERIATQNKIIEDLKKLKSAINQKLFDGAVSTFRIGDVLIEENLRTKENNQYDVLSSTVGGLCLQSEYFNKEVASEDNSGYKILLKDRIVLSPQNLWLGNINYNELFEIGIVSPSYKIFRISNSINKIYLAEVLRSQYALYQYSISSEQGASVVRRNLNVEDFLNINFPKVSIEKQESFAKLLISVNNKLRNNTTILSQFLIQKRYLLSQMFI